MRAVKADAECPARLAHDLFGETAGFDVADAGSFTHCLDEARVPDSSGVAAGSQRRWAETINMR